uniref:Angiotensin-converting enzyme n=1 Tax=Anopheles albimanus TaxID=7167 RepID=A0A182FFW1_ANOAL
MLTTPASESAAREWFDRMNAELQSLNHEASQYAWDLSIQDPEEPHGESTVDGLVQLAQRKARWLEQVCAEGSHYRQYGWPYDRAYYLLCRGSRNSRQELREMARLFSFVQRIYTETEICLPAKHRCSAMLLWSDTFVRYPEHATARLDLTSVAPLPAEVLRKRSSEREMRPRELACFHGEPDLERIMLGEDRVGPQVCHGAISEETVLQWAWESWRMAVGPPMRQPYGRLIELMNAGCLRGANQRDVGECWREELEIPDLRQLVDRLWQDVKPFYQKLHAVVRHFVRRKHPESASLVGDDGLIPAHLLGGMWSHSWTGYARSILPHPVDIDRRFHRANWTAIDLVRRAEDLYASLGLERMSETFWNRSVIGNEAVVKCHGTAANMYAPSDYRMIVCPPKDDGATLQDYYVTVHEMGHIVYYMEAGKQPTIFQDGTSAAFQEAFGDAMFLAAVTPQHLVRLSLLDSKHMAPEIDEYDGFGGIADHSTLNSFDYAFLLRIALTKVPTIPFEYLMDVYRWDLFDGSVDYDQDPNRYFWYLLEGEQGIRAPSVAPRDALFDAGAGFHLSDNTPFVRYFLASFLSYQIYEGLCKGSLYGTVRENPINEIPMPLHRCDLYGSKKAGKLLRKALAPGASVHWTTVLEQLTGEADISAASMLKYYAPLIDFLDRFIDEHQLVVGWTD